MPKISPKVALTIACISRKRLTRCPASSTNLVATTILPVARQPDDPIAKFLALQQHEDDQDDGESQLAESTPATGSRTRSAATSRRRSAAPRSRRSASWWRGRSPRSPRGSTSSTSVRCGGPGTPPSSWLISVIIFLSWLEFPVASLNVLTFSLTVWRVLGQFLEQAGDLRGDQPADRRPGRTSPGERPGSPTACVGSPRCRNHATNGLSRKVRKAASATGMKTDWAQYKATITTTLTTVPVNVMSARCQAVPTDVLVTTEYLGIDPPRRWGGSGSLGKAGMLGKG